MFQPRTCWRISLPSLCPVLNTSFSRKVLVCFSVCCGMDLFLGEHWFALVFVISVWHQQGGVLVICAFCLTPTVVSGGNVSYSCVRWPCILQSCFILMYDAIALLYKNPKYLYLQTDFAVQ